MNVKHVRPFAVLLCLLSVSITPFGLSQAIAAPSQGTWVNEVGKDGFALAAFDNATTPRISMPLANISIDSVGGNGAIYSDIGGYVFAGSTTDVRALESPEQDRRTSGTWYSDGTVTVTLTFTESFNGPISVYALDWNSQNRSQTLDISSPGGTVSVQQTNMASGTWAETDIDVVAGDVVTVTAARITGSNAVIAGVFLGRAVNPPFLSPNSNNTLNSATGTFDWLANDTEVDEWWFYAGTTPGDNDIDDSGNLFGAPSHTIADLPTDGSIIYVRLYYRVAGQRWYYVDRTFAAADISEPAITSPAPDSVLTGASQSFSWSANGTSVDQWWLYVGSSVGSNAYGNSGNLFTATTATVAGIPTDSSTIYTRLYYRANGERWSHVDQTFTAAQITEPTITSHVNNEVLTSANEEFSWNANGTTVNEWWFYAGSSEGARDYVNSGNLYANTSINTSGLAFDGSLIYVRLFYRTSGGPWSYIDRTYTAVSATVPAITSPQPTDIVSATNRFFSWSANGTPVDEWWLYVGSSVGARDIEDTGNLYNKTSTIINGLPADGSTIFVRLFYRTSGSAWAHEDSVYITEQKDCTLADYDDTCTSVTFTAGSGTAAGGGTGHVTYFGPNPTTPPVQSDVCRSNPLVMQLNAMWQGTEPSVSLTMPSGATLVYDAIDTKAIVSNGNWVLDFQVEDNAGAVVDSTVAGYLSSGYYWDKTRYVKPNAWSWTNGSSVTALRLEAFLVTAVSIRGNEDATTVFNSAEIRNAQGEDITNEVCAAECEEAGGVAAVLDPETDELLCLAPPPPGLPECDLSNEDIAGNVITVTELSVPIIQYALGGGLAGVNIGTFGTGQIITGVIKDSAGVLCSVAVTLSEN